MPKQDLHQYVQDVISDPIVAKSVPAATIGLGLNELVNWIESGFAFAAMIIGFMTTVLVWRNFKLQVQQTELQNHESKLKAKETELRIKMLEHQLEKE